MKNQIRGKNNLFENFLNSTKKFSNLLSLNMYQEKSLKAAWENLHTLGLEMMQQSMQLYRSISQNLKNSLSNEIQVYFLRELYSILLFLLGTCFVLMPYLTQTYRHPLENLKNAAEKLSGGDFSVRIPVEEANEVGAVSKSFNETAEIFEKTEHFCGFGHRQSRGYF